MDIQHTGWRRRSGPRPCAPLPLKYQPVVAIVLIYVQQVRDPDFVLVKNYSWTSDDPKAMHALAIFSDRSLFCIRELRSHHVSMLKRMRDVCLARLHELYGLSPDRICARFHYLPTFYHLHLHFEVKDNCEYASNRYRGFDEVVSLLDVVADGYQRMTLEFSAKPGGKGVAALLMQHKAQ